MAPDGGSPPSGARWNEPGRRSRRAKAGGPEDAEGGAAVRPPRLRTTRDYPMLKTCLIRGNAK